MLVVPFNPQVVNTGSKLVVFDTGFGPGAPTRASAYGRQHDGGRHRPKSIDSVILRTCIRTTPTASRRPTARWCSPCRDQAAGQGLGVLDERGECRQGGTDMMKNYFANVRKVFAGLENK